MSSFRLLTPGNPKTAKGESAGFWTFILHLAPGSLSGFNTCAKATPGCLAACLNTAGRGGMMAGVSRLTLDMIASGTVNAIQAARIRKAKAFFEGREAFMFELVREIERAIVKARKEGYTPVFRLNGTSDIRWELVKVPAMAGTWSSKPEGSANVFDHFPDVQFYDYTKLPNRRRIPANYALTFSLADGNDDDAAKALANGMNVAAVFRNKETVARYETEGFTIGAVTHPVFNGDATDLRFLDPANHVIALYAKGNAKRDLSGFVRD
jgi:hypothetical protein